jgi:opacity protein-like surface antigen
VGADLQYKLSQDITLEAAYEYLDLGEANINQTGGNLRGDLKGDFEKNQIHFFGFNMVWKF